MMPYPASGDDADRAAKLQEESNFGATSSARGRAESRAERDDQVAREAQPCPGAADDDGEIPLVWKRYIDSRLKQFCTR